MLDNNVKNWKLPAGNHDEANATMPTSQVIRTSDGKLCNYKEKGVYVIVETGEIVTSDHPAAP
jgi:hypothetical protein